jgi:hypothetical protein
MLKKAVQQCRSSADDPRFTFHASRFTVPGSEARTTLADFFSILLGVAAGSTVRTRALTDFFTIWH